MLSVSIGEIDGERPRLEVGSPRGCSVHLGDPLVLADAYTASLLRGLHRPMIHRATYAAEPSRTPCDEFSRAREFTSDVVTTETGLPDFIAQHHLEAAGLPRRSHVYVMILLRWLVGSTTPVRVRVFVDFLVERLGGRSVT